MHNVVTSEFKIFLSRNPDVGIPDSVQRLLRSFQYQTRLPNPVLRINHGVNNDVSTVLLSSYNKRNNNNRTKQTNTHTRDPRRNLTSHDRSQHENKGQLFQLIRTFAKKVGVWKENASEIISLMQLISNSKQAKYSSQSLHNEFKALWMKIVHI